MSSVALRAPYNTPLHSPCRSTPKFRCRQIYALIGSRSQRLTYATALAIIAIPGLIAVLFAVLVMVATALSWATTGALGQFSIALAIATQWAVEPTPEGTHTFLNGGWSRDASVLEQDRGVLQHSDPYVSPAVVEAVVEFVRASVEPPLSSTRPVFSKTESSLNAERS